jgi:aspartyl protease family protein
MRFIQRSALKNALAMAAFWMALLGVLYLGFAQVEKHRAKQFQSYALATGELLIPRQPNGHFEVPGEVNHQPVMFLVDTGASHVSVSRSLAEEAGLPSGSPIRLQSANGTLSGELVRNVPVRVGHLVLNQTTVAVGLVGVKTNEALLGQGFLKNFDVEMRRDEMVLRPRP